MTGGGVDLFSLEYDELVEYLKSLDEGNLAMFDDFAMKLTEAIIQIRVNRELKDGVQRKDNL